MNRSHIIKDIQIITRTKLRRKGGSTKIQKVPLSVAWLSENDMLEKALKQVGLTLPKVDSKGAAVIDTTGKEVKSIHLNWEDNVLFTINQLKKLGFE